MAPGSDPGCRCVPRERGYSMRHVDCFRPAEPCIPLQQPTFWRYGYVGREHRITYSAKSCTVYKDYDGPRRLRRGAAGGTRSHKYTRNT